MKMKKVFAGLVLFGATLALVACGSSSSTSESSSSEAKTEATTTSTTWQDGTYSGESDYDERGWKVVQTITIKDGKITESTFDYEDKDGNKKSDDTEYNEAMEKQSGVSSKDATTQLNEQLVKTQNIDEVEVVSGATNSSNNFIASTKALLAAAAEGNTDKVTFDLGE